MQPVYSELPVLASFVSILVNRIREIDKTRLERLTERFCTMYELILITERRHVANVIVYDDSLIVIIK